MEESILFLCTGGTIDKCYPRTQVDFDGGGYDDDDGEEEEVCMYNEEEEEDHSYEDDHNDGDFPR